MLYDQKCYDRVDSDSDIVLAPQTLPMYTDNVAQVCFQFSLLRYIPHSPPSHPSLFSPSPSCYLLTLLTVDSGPLVFHPSQPLPCLLAIAGLQFFYLAAFTFLLLESLVVLHKLVDAVMLPLLESSACILLSGFLLPGLYTGFTLAVFWDALLPRQEAMCWVNLSSPTALSSILPIIFLFLATTVILLTAICAAQVPGHPPKFGHFP